MRFFDQGTKFFPRATTYGSVSHKILLEQTFYCLTQLLPGLRVSEIRPCPHSISFSWGWGGVGKLPSSAALFLQREDSDAVWLQWIYSRLLCLSTGTPVLLHCKCNTGAWGCSEAWLMGGIWVFLQHCWLVRKLTAPLSSSYMNKYVHWSQDMGIKH